MIGRFIEIAVPAHDILRSIGFYEQLGFHQLSTGDMWPHPYAVLSDGRVQIGLHDTELAGPLITFVLPDLAAQIDELRSRGLHVDNKHTADDEFNELIGTDLDRNHIRVVEARTFSPAGFDVAGTSACGRFREVALPVRDLGSAAQFWQRFGFERSEVHETPYPYARLKGAGTSLGLHETRDLVDVALVFTAPQLERLETLGIELPLHRDLPDFAVLHSPERLMLLLARG